MTKGLSKRQQLFIAEYLQDMNATRAATAAGYSAKTAQEQGSRLLSNVLVAAEIEKNAAVKLEKLDISLERILIELARIAFADPRKLFNSDGSHKKITELDDDAAATIASFELVELFDGSQGEQKHVTGLAKKVKQADKIRCLELLGKYRKLWTDKVEHGGGVTLEELVTGVPRRKGSY